MTAQDILHPRILRPEDSEDEEYATDNTSKALRARHDSDLNAMAMLNSGKRKESVNKILGSAWDSICMSSSSSSHKRRILILIYSSGMSLWDMGNLEEARELFSLTSSITPNTKIVCARLVPTMRSWAEGEEDIGSASKQPVLAIL